MKKFVSKEAVEALQLSESTEAEFEKLGFHVYLKRNGDDYPTAMAMMPAGPKSEEVKIIASQWLVRSLSGEMRVLSDKDFRKNYVFSR